MLYEIEGHSSINIPRDVVSQQIFEGRIDSICDAFLKEPSRRLSWGRTNWILSRYGFLKNEFMVIVHFLAAEDLISYNRCCIFINHDNLRKRIVRKK